MMHWYALPPASISRTTHSPSARGRFPCRLPAVPGHTAGWSQLPAGTCGPVRQGVWCAAYALRSSLLPAQLQTGARATADQPCSMPGTGSCCRHLYRGADRPASQSGIFCLRWTGEMYIGERLPEQGIHDIENISRRACLYGLLPLLVRGDSILATCHLCFSVSSQASSASSFGRAETSCSWPVPRIRIRQLPWYIDEVIGLVRAEIGCLNFMCMPMPGIRSSVSDSRFWHQT